MLCQTDSPISRLTGGCNSQGRWVGPDGKVRCSLHHTQEFGFSERLVRVAGYEAPSTPKPPAPRRERSRSG